MYRLALLGLLAASLAEAEDPPTLQLEVKIPLGDVRGRIDHLAIDSRRQRLFVAELGNDSVGIVDLRQQKTIRHLTGLKGPQGIGYVTSSDTLFIANAGDGSVRIFQGDDLTAGGAIALGDDADNVRIDDGARRVFVGYGSGAIAVINSDSQQKVGDIVLKAHPESFQLDSVGHRLFANVPDAHQIAVVDRTADKQVEGWTTGALRANFPMALAPADGRVLVVFRHPAKLGVFDAESGRMISAADTCADSDDVFVDAKRSRVYLSCGEGFIDVFALKDGSYERLGRLPTAPGARTSLFNADLDKLMVAVPARAAQPAAIWVYRPAP
jgi:hypothetical protein